MQAFKDNELLAALHLSDGSETLQRRQAFAGERLYEIGDTIDRVYFPVSGALALYSVMSDGGSLATSTVGRDNVAGLIEAVGSRCAWVRCACLIDAEVISVPASAIRRAHSAEAQTRDVIHAVAELQLADAQQALGCAAMHTVIQRMAWWLLILQDELDESAQVPITQEDLAGILAVQRTTISAAATALEGRGVVRTGRGRVQILDREALKRTSCECYETGKTLRSRILQPAVSGERGKDGQGFRHSLSAPRQTLEDSEA